MYFILYALRVLCSPSGGEGRNINIVKLNVKPICQKYIFAFLRYRNICNDVLMVHISALNIICQICIDT